MKNMFYLLNVGISGIKSIEKEVRLNFYKKTVDKNFDPEKYRIKAIYGENGSGKSSLITAIKIFKDLILNDYYLADSKNQIFLDEIINKNTKTFKFDLEYLVDTGTDKYVYFYGVEISKNDNGNYEIIHEILKVKNGNYKNNKYNVVFESKNGELIQLNCNDKEKDIIVKKTINLLSINSFIYLYIMNYNDVTTKNVTFFLHIVLLVGLIASIKVYIGEEDQHQWYFLKKRIKESNIKEDYMLTGWKEFSDSLSKFSSVNEKTVKKEYFERYKERVERLTRFIKIFKSNLVSIEIDAKENGENYECDLNLNYGNYIINKEFESTGIKKLIRLFDCFDAASSSGIVFIDEMDSNLNDVYLCKLIEYFMYYGNGQLCFTTHNLDPMSILKGNKNSIDFLSSDNHLVSWASRGNASPDNCYKNGLIEDSPFNIDATDFLGILGE